MLRSAERLRAKSIQQTEYLIFLAHEWLAPLGFEISSPLDPVLRGSHVSIKHLEAYRINRAMIETQTAGLRIIPDFRAPDNLRLGIAPIYTTFTNIHRALARIREIVETQEYRQYSADRAAVT